jgi:hypothetical protein
VPPGKRPATKCRKETEKKEIASWSIRGDNTFFRKHCVMFAGTIQNRKAIERI